MNSTAYRAVDLFCGAGGLSLGLQRAGFQVAYASDLDAIACETYRQNLGSHIEHADIANLTASHILAKSRAEIGELAVVAGAPPCQGFSVQRRGSTIDSRNDLVLRFYELALELRPKAILMENVVTLFGIRGRSETAGAERMCTSAGYSLHRAILDANQFDVPQHRRRAFMVAIRGDVASRFEFPAPQNKRPLTVRDAIGDLPSPPRDYTNSSHIANHIRVKISDLNTLRISHVPPGGGRQDIPFELQLPCHQKNDGHRHLDVYGRMRWDSPAPTITAMFDNFTRGRFAHPSEDRPITGREGARLQSFPDSFHFVGPKKTVARHIGNAVPPNLAFHVANAIRLCLGNPERSAWGSHLLPLS